MGTLQLSRKYFIRIALAKKSALEDKLEEALEFLSQAGAHRKTDKVTTRFDALQKLIAEITEGVQSGSECDNKEKNLEREGIQWMWNAVHQGNISLSVEKRIYGGLLSDDMGLGKTIQVAAFISALVDMEEATHFLIFVPNSLIANWESELKKWAPNLEQFLFTGELQRKKREQNLREAKKSNSAVVIASYGLCNNNIDVFNSYGSKDWTWDYMILDEAHTIKNSSTKTAKTIVSINSTHRLLMTGTPVMNKLVDFYNLINVLSQGTMLKMSQHKFIKEYMKPIENGRKKNAPAFAVHRANTLSKVIRDKTDFWILRRTKKEVNQASTASSGSGSTFPTLPAKNDFVLWCKMTARQLVIYNGVRNALMAKSSPLVQCTLLNMICNCPRIMPNYLVGDTHNNDSDLKNFDCVPLEELLAESAKILIFSNSKKILTIIEKLLSGKNIKYDRIDGTIQPKERNNKVHRFQTDSTIKVCLLTTGVGAVGLTLTAATRVIVFDPYWNPSKDDQAVDRAYRIGQKNAVVVFRLITCETIEEKIYSKQLFKKSIICQNNGENDDPTRLFNDKDIYELFKSPVSKAENMFSGNKTKFHN
ncbi:unnamed protein product [Oikopleura dioica]|uniref:Uncharacterized protein n=1 Tax=Oikopleura dioica TaxID=34765 RepID=E4XUX8_OIKDI|nr:unnamed protein product [Oikopleura dioica]